MPTKRTRRENAKEKKRARCARVKKKRARKIDRRDLVSKRDSALSAYTHALRRFNLSQQHHTSSFTGGLDAWLEKQKNWGAAFWRTVETAAFDAISDRDLGLETRFTDEVARKRSAPGAVTFERSTLGAEGAFGALE